MLNISKIGMTYLDAFHAIMDPFTRMILQHASSAIQEEPKGSAEGKVKDIEMLIVGELFDNSNQLFPDMIARIKRVSKKLAERSERSRKPPTILSFRM